jgi:hypothetical protein
MSMARQSMSQKNRCSIYTTNFILKVASFPLVGNPSASKERFWTSQNDRIKDFKKTFKD